MEWSYVCMGEPRAVERMIRNRSRLDTSYLALDDGIADMASSRMIDMDEPVRCTYIDLDRLLDRCGLNGRQEVTVTMLMHGYSFGDIAEMLDCDLRAIRSAFKAAVAKVTRQNMLDWGNSYRAGT